MSQGDTPIVHQRRLRFELRRLREAVELTQKDAAERLDWSVSKIIRIESGATNVGITDLRALLMLYRLDDEDKVNSLVEEARESRKQAWWTSYRSSIEAQFYTFIGYEASAAGILQYQSLAMPGLLQTPAYASALVAAFGYDEETVQRGVDIRMKRQYIVAPGGPTLEFVLDEAVVRRRVGGVAVMREQLRNLLRLVELKNLSIRILPFTADGHIGLKGSFSVLNLGGPEQERVLVLEEPLRDVLIRDDQAEVERYSVAFERLKEMSLSENRSIEVIAGLVTDLV